MTRLKRLLSATILTHSPPPFSPIKCLSLIALLTFSVAACHTPQRSTGQFVPFTLLNASSQEWTAGIEGGGSGIEYYFKIALHTGTITFDTMWVNSKALPVFIARETTTVSGAPITYAKGDTIIVGGSDLCDESASSPVKLPSATHLLRVFSNQKVSELSIIQFDQH